MDAGMELTPWKQRHAVFQTYKGIRRLLGDSTTPKMALTLPDLHKMAEVVLLRRKDKTKKVL